MNNDFRNAPIGARILAVIVASGIILTTFTVVVTIVGLVARLGLWAWGVVV